MPNKASEHVDWAYAHVHNILDLQCQISQLITRVDETDKKLGQLNKQFETRNDEIMQTMLANGKKDIDELSEKLKASQVEVDELKQNLSDMQGQLNQSIDEIKKDMADLSRVHPANDAPPSGNQPQPTFNETMDKLRRKLDHFTDSLIPKEASQRRRSIIQSHRNETRQNYRPRPQSLLLESSLSETMDSPVLQRSHSASSTGSSGLGTLPDQQSGKSLPAIGEQNIHLSFLNSSTFFKEFSPLGPNAVSERRRPVIQSHRNDNRPFPQSQLLESKTMDFLEHPSTSSTSSGRDSLSHQPSLESLLEIGITEQPSQGPLPEIHITEQDSASLLPNESSQMRYQISTSALFASQQSNEISFETQHIIEVLWAMGDLVDHLKNLAGNFVGNTSDTYKKPDN